MASLLATRIWRETETFSTYAAGQLGNSQTELLHLRRRNILVTEEDNTALGDFI